MTNQEAIKEFESELKWAELKKYPYVSKQKIEADKMAIKALEQMPTTTSTDEPMTVIYPTIFCDDAVSREAVCEIINDIRDCISVEGYCAILERLKKLPPVQPKSETVTEFADRCRECGKRYVKRQTGKWIPVSKRLPKEAFGCLVTILDTDLRTQDEFENILPYTVGYDGETWNNFCGEPIPFEVVAWMPLPEPYKAESEERMNELELSTYQIYLILLGYLTERHDDTEILQSMLIELYKRANKTESEEQTE